jgi:diketogulonate reductase-like aldo/keto reductase
MVELLGKKKISPIGIGTWKMGGKDGMDRTHDADDVKAISYALDHGVNVIDTAEIYGKGHSEELVAKAIKGRDRESLYIITKVHPAHLEHDQLMRSARASLDRMGCGYIDLYLVHWAPPRIEMVREGLRAMEELVSKGLVRSIGVSNFSSQETLFAMESLRREKLVANQIEYSLLAREPESDIIPFCEKNGIVVISYTPLADGRVATYGPAMEVARSLGRTPVQVALNYLMRNSLPIPKASRVDHMKEILGSMGWSLDPKDVKRLQGG